jgi:Lon protease-like protein
VFPLDVVLFPGESFGLHVFEERYLLMTEECLASDLPIGVVLARPDQPEDRVEFEPEKVGTAARIVDAQRVGDRYLLSTVGTHRFRIVKLYSEKPYQEADVEWLAEPAGDVAAAAALAEEVLEAIESVGGEVDWDHEGVHDPVRVSHVVASRLPFDLATKQRLLEAADAQERLAAEAEIIEVVF